MGRGREGRGARRWQLRSLEELEVGEKWREGCSRVLYICITQRTVFALRKLHEDSEGSTRAREEVIVCTSSFPCYDTLPSPANQRACALASHSKHDRETRVRRHWSGRRLELESRSQVELLPRIA